MDVMHKLYAWKRNSCGHMGKEKHTLQEQEQECMWCSGLAGSTFGKCNIMQGKEMWVLLWRDGIAKYVSAGQSVELLV